MKTCYLCKKSQNFDQFIQKRNNTHYNMCKTCVSSILSQKKNKKRLHHTESHRTCYLCLRLLEVQNFTRRSTGTYFSACKECNKNVFAHRRRARMNEAEGSFTTEEWNNLVQKTSNCPLCKRKWEEIPVPKGRKSVITRDHIQPISKGGSNNIDNIQPLCYSCNSKKGDR